VQAADVVEASAPITELPGLFVLNGATSTATQGTDGGTATTSLCPGDQVVVGYQGTVNHPSIVFVASVQLICGEVDVVGPTQLSISTGVTLPVQGSTGDTTFSATCPAGQAVVGIYGNYGLLVDQLGLECAPLTRTSTGSISVGSSTQLPANGGTGGGAYDDPCPSGQVVRGGDFTTSGWLYSVAADCAVPTAPSCVEDLSSISTGSFHVSFTVQTTQAGSVALVNQRGTCDLQPYWDVRLENGNVQAETDDGGTFYHVTTSGTLVNDGQPHAILVERVQGTLSIFIDGVQSASTSSLSGFAKLPPFEVGLDPCDNVDGTVALVGSLTNLCLTAQ
jgi:hypothetical protein